MNTKFKVFIETPLESMANPELTPLILKSYFNVVVNEVRENCFVFEFGDKEIDIFRFFAMYWDDVAGIN